MRAKRIMKLREIADAIGVSYITLSDKRAKGKDFPKIKSGNNYDAREVCEWIVLHSNHQSSMARGAEDYLLKLKGGDAPGKKDTAPKRVSAPLSPSHPSPSAPAHDGSEGAGEAIPETLPPPEPPEPPAPPESVDTIVSSANVSTEDDYTGFAMHVRWLGQAMIDTWKRYQEALSVGDEAAMQSATRTYNVQLETLRKAEGSRVELERSLGELILRDVARQKFTALCINIRSKLMPLGAKLCHELTNQRSAKKVKEIIDSEVRDVLGSIADKPF